MYPELTVSVCVLFINCPLKVTSLHFFQKIRFISILAEIKVHLNELKVSPRNDSSTT